MLEGLVGSLLHDQDQLLVISQLKVLHAALKLAHRDLLQSVILILFVLKLLTLLEADEDVLVAFYLFLQLLMASLRLLDLQVQRLDVALYLLDTLDDLLFKDLLPVCHIVGRAFVSAMMLVVRGTCISHMVVGKSRFQIGHLALVLRVRERARANHHWLSASTSSRTIRRSQVVQFEELTATASVCHEVIRGAHSWLLQ